MARFISEAANAAHRAHQADASGASSLAAQAPCYLHRRGLTREVQHPVIRDGMPSEGI